jgi:hypothetical protein
MGSGGARSAEMHFQPMSWIFRMKVSRGGCGSITARLQEIEAAAQGRTRIAAGISQESVPNDAQRHQPIASMCGDELGRQPGICFERHVEVGAAIEFAKQLQQRLRAECVDAGGEIPQPDIRNCVAFDQGRVLYRSARGPCEKVGLELQGLLVEISMT